jgi:hypothetical protein
MKIGVGTRSRTSGKEPCRLCLGQRSLPVITVLDRRDEGNASLYTVRVLDGRRFALRRTDDGQWDLVGAYGRATKPAEPVHSPMLSLIALLLVARSRKAFQFARRAGRWPARHPGALPGGGAPA